MRKICTQEAWCCWNVHFTTGQKRIFRHEKWRKFPYSLRGTLVARIVKNLIRLLKFGKFLHTMVGTCGKFDNKRLGILATWISRQGKTHSQASKIRKFPLFSRYLETLVSRIGRNRIFRLTKCGRIGNMENSLTRNMVPLKRVFHDWGKSIFRPQKLRGALKFWFHESSEITF